MDTFNSDNCCDEMQSNALPMASSQVVDSCSMKDCIRNGAIELTKHEIELLHYRAKDVHWNRICKEHYRFFVSGYELLQKYCCDPLKRHRKRCYNNRYTHLTLPFVKDVLSSTLADVIDISSLIPGNRVCKNCMAELQSLLDCNDMECPPQSSDVEFAVENVAEPEVHIDIHAANKLVQEINRISNSNISPIKNHSLTPAKKERLKKRKLSQISEKTDEILDKSLNCSINNDDNVEIENGNVPSTSASDDKLDKAQMFDNMMVALAAKLSDQGIARDEKIKYLTMLPKEFSRQQIVNQFGVSYCMVNESRKLEFLEGPQLHRGREFSPDVVSLVRQMYEDDEYSRLLPGKRDCVSVVHGKQWEQKRLMLLTVSQLYAAFKRKYASEPNIKIGISKFYALRPKWCIPAGKSGTHAVCCCTIHENVKLLCDALSSQIHYKDLVSLAVCELDSRDCCLLKCDLCPSIDYMKAYLLTYYPDYESDDELTVTFKEWVSVDRADLVQKTLPVMDFIDHLLDKLYKLIPHSYIARKQAAYFKDRKANLKAGEVLCCMDFAENYSYVIQNEIQGYHWTNKYCTVHPCVCYFKVKNANGDLETRHKSFCFLSEEVVHNVPMVHAFQTRLMVLLKDEVGEIVSVEYITDGCAEQYKNFKSFCNIVYHVDDHGVPCIWSFYATSHGKSACDGLGGSIKRRTADESLRRPASNGITNVHQMLEYCQSAFTDVHFEVTTKQDIDRSSATIERRIAMSSTLCGTRGFHFFKHLGNGKIGAKILSGDEGYAVLVDHVPILSFSLTDFHFGDYIAFVYDRKWYIGYVSDMDIDRKELEVQSMHPNGPSQSFIWPTRPDTVWVTMTQLLCHLDCPNLSSSRGHYQISNEMSTKINQMWDIYLQCHM